MARQIQASISLDDSRFNNSIKDIQGNLRNINSAFKVSQQELNQFGHTTQTVAGMQDGYNRKIQELTKLQQQYTQAIAKERQELDKNNVSRNKMISDISSQEQKIQQLTTAYGANSKEVKQEEQALRGMIGALQNVERDITTNNSKINSYNTTINRSQLEINQAQQGLQNLGQAFNNTSTQITQANNSLKAFNVGEVVNTVKAGADKISNAFKTINTHIIGFGKQILQSGMNFEATMSNVKALAEANNTEMELLEERAKKLGGTTQKSAQEVAGAYEVMAQAGMTTTQMLEGIDSVIMASVASGEELSLVANVMGTSLSAFGYEAKESARVLDVLNMAGAKTNTDIAGLGEALKYVASTSGALGMSIEDTAMAIGIMSNNGIQGSMAGTTLKNVLSNLAKPTTQMKQVMEEYGLSLTDTEGNMLSLGAIMDTLRAKLGGLSEDQQANIATTLFGKESMSGALSIINASAESYNGLRDSIYNSTGATKEMADVVGDNVAGSFNLLKGQIETLKLKAFDALYPVITKIIDKVTIFLDKLNGMSDAQIDNILNMAKLSLILGVVTKAFSGLVGTVGGGIQLFANLKTLTGGLSVATGALAPALTGATAGIGALASSMGTALLAVAPWALAIGVVAVAGVVAYKEATKDCIAEVDLFADAMVDSNVRMTDEMGNFTGQYVQQQVKITEATKSRLETVMDLEEQHRKDLITITSRKKEMTQEEYTAMLALEKNLTLDLKEESRKRMEEELAVLKGKYEKEKELTAKENELLISQTEEINRITKENLNKKYEEETKILTDYYTKTMGLTVEEATKKIEFMQQAQSDDLMRLEDYNNAYLALMQKKMEDGVTLTVQEQQELARLREEIKNFEIQTLSETELEANIIQNRLKDSSLRIDAETAGELVKNAEDLRAKRVAEAEAEYLEYERIMTEKKATTGLISDAEYNDEIQKAKAKKIELIENANDEKLGIIAKLEELNKDALNSVNTNNGEMLGKWQKFWGSWNIETEDNANKSNTLMQKIKNGIDGIPDKSIKEVEIKTTYTTGGTKPTGMAYAPGYNLGYSGYNLNNNLNNIKSYSSNLNDTSSFEKGLKAELNVLKESINYMANKLVSAGDSIPQAVNNIKDNLQVNNKIYIGQKMVTDIVDTGLNKNRKQTNIFNGNKRGI